jgi:hypothetical protein
VIATYSIPGTAEGVEERRPGGARDDRGRDEHGRRQDVRLDREEAEEVPVAEGRERVVERGELVRHRDDAGRRKRDPADDEHEVARLQDGSNSRSGAYGRGGSNEARSGRPVRR